MTKLLIAILFICTLAQGLAQKIYYRPYSKAYNESVGGIKDVQLMVSKEFQYPIKTVQQELDGEVRLSFQLNRKGAVTDLKVVSSTTPEMAKEATRLFKKIQWTKSEYRPIHMTFRDEFIVEFNLKKWVKLYNKRGYQYIDYPVTPIDTSEKIYFIKAAARTGGVFSGSSAVPGLSYDLTSIMHPRHDEEAAARRYSQRGSRRPRLARARARAAAWVAVLHQ